MASAPFRISGSKLAERRVRCGYTQSQLADAIGVYRSYINSLESETYQPSPGRLVAIAEALGCDIDDITDRVAA